MGEEQGQKFRKYTEEEKMFFRSYTYGHGYQEITDEFNRRFEPEIRKSQVKDYIKNNNLTTGRTGRFEKGHVPDNKGMKGICAPGCEKTWFKKGDKPRNHKPVGTESIRRSKKNEAYVYVKVAEPNKWRMKHTIEWEKVNGPIPKGMVIIFLDGDTTNTDISNLQIVSRKVNARINQNHLRYNDADLTMTGINIAKVITKIGEMKKRK